eukprot:SAG31_NODE_1365_length_8621_cov_61.731049_8_plen_101_part_00
MLDSKWLRGLITQTFVFRDFSYRSVLVPTSPAVHVAILLIPAVSGSGYRAVSAVPAVPAVPAESGYMAVPVVPAEPAVPEIFVLGTPPPSFCGSSTSSQS